MSKERPVLDEGVGEWVSDLPMAGLHGHWWRLDSWAVILVGSYSSSMKIEGDIELKVQTQPSLIRNVSDAELYPSAPSGQGTHGGWRWWWRRG